MNFLQVYVIGGISDGTVVKRASLDAAESMPGVECRRLPIQEHCTKQEQGTFSKVMLT